MTSTLDRWMALVGGAARPQCKGGADLQNLIDHAPKFSALNADQQIQMANLLVSACERGNDDVVDVLLQMIPVACVPYEALALAAAYGLEGVVRRLLDAGVNANIRREFIHENSALEEAASHGHMGIVEMLLAQNADATLHQSLALRLACQWQNVDVARVLIPHSNPKNANSEALQHAVRQNNSALIDLLYAVSDVEVALREMDKYLDANHLGLMAVRQRAEAQENQLVLHKAVGSDWMAEKPILARKM